ncbi:MAG: hypothetical protein KAR14_16100 [Candidatus Aminicenantes bacterium]|nr:hypothetical protein [Candidatus Aminicenantes bacterium]
MILLIAAVFVAMIFSTGCAKKFDITGTWTLTYNWFAVSNTAKTSSTLSAMQGAAAAGSDIIIFTGDKKSGTFLIPADNFAGTYSVDGDNVRWVFDSGTTYVGTSTDDNTMSGTMSSSYMDGTWSAIR